VRIAPAAVPLVLVQRVTTDPAPCRSETRIGAVGGPAIVTFHRLDDTTTRVTCQLDFEPQGVAEQAGDRLGFLDRQVKGDLKRF